MLVITSKYRRHGVICYSFAVIILSIYLYLVTASYIFIGLLTLSSSVLVYNIVYLIKNLKISLVE